METRQTVEPVVEHSRLDASDVEVSRIGLGTWAIGGWMWGGTDEAASVAAIQSAVDAGMTLVDTAPVYGFGESESLIGRALAEGGRRDRVTLATKAGIEWSRDHQRVRRNAKRSRILEEVDASLERLGTDRIDLYQVHWPDPLVEIHETADAMAELYRAGKIRAVGVSNFSTRQMAIFREAAPLHASQSPYNVFERAIDGDVGAYCRDHGIALVTYGALCRGLLSGRMHRERTFAGDDLRNADPKFQQPRFDQYLAAASALDEFARTHFAVGVRELAVRWILDQPGYTSALWGARRPGQLEGIEGAIGWQLDDASLREVTRIVDEHVSDPVGPEFMAPPAREGS
jgi:aryl-alcohol dehydrogenase-like predicted oxidoreductase